MRVIAVWDWKSKGGFKEKKMKFDLGEVLSRMWKIGWNHKVLWLWQMIPGASVIFVFPSFFIYYPVFTRLVKDPELQIPIEPWMSISLNSMAFLFMLSYVILGIFAQITTVCGMVEIEKGIVKISFGGLFRKSLSYFRRVFGLYFLFGSVWTLIYLGSVSILFAVRKVDVDLLVVSSIPILCMFIPATLVGVSVLELAQASVVMDDKSVLSAISHGWKLFKANALNALMLAIILYFGMNLLFSFFVGPFMFLVPISLLFLTRLPDPTTIFSIVFFIVAPLVIILPTLLIGILVTFFQSAWAVAYMRMNRNLNTPTGSEETLTETGI